ncbi:hypothetical protein JW968_02775 [Candidatus Woesearchaeota archaeon]|nr:hypothetical protein [Candidatus Woesearchaeota archaeon]
MRGLKFFSLAAIMFMLMSVSALAAYDYQMDYVCEDDDCRQGHQITWIFTYKNHGGKVLALYKINLKTPSGSSIAHYEDIFEIAPSETRTLNFTSVLPAPNTDNEVVYNICFTRKVDYDDWWALGYEVNRSEFIDKNLEFCYDDNYTLPVKPANYCPGTLYCGDDEVCINTRCTKLNCSECQFPRNHSCHDFECCTPGMCNDASTCINNTCTPLVCRDNEVIMDHHCVDMECTPDEYKSGFFCIKLNCADDEKAVDHRCIKLYCGKRQVIKDHECVDVLCHFFQKAEDGSCRTDYFRIAFLALIVLVVVISPFILINHKRKNDLYRHQRHCPKCGAVLGPRDSFCYKCRYDLKSGEKL